MIAYMMVIELRDLIIFAEKAKVASRQRIFPNIFFWKNPMFHQIIACYFCLISTKGFPNIISRCMRGFLQNYYS